MKEKKYMDDWVTEVSLNPVTGKEKRTAVYRGEWYVHGAGSPEKRARALWAALPCIGYLALILLYFRLDFPGVRTLYVFLPAALSLFPALYWAIGAWGVFAAPEKMTRLQKEKGVERVLRSAAGCAFCALAAMVGDVIFLLTGSAAGESPGLALLVTAGILAYAVTRRFSRLSRDMTARKEDKP